MNILYAFGCKSDDAVGEIEELSSQDRHKITFVNYREEFDITRRFTPYEVDTLYRNKDEKFIAFYDKVESLSGENDVLIAAYDNFLHPEFVRKLKRIYKVLISADDPESSFVCSQPYVYAFDHVFAVGVYYDDVHLVMDMFELWGAKRVGFWPLGVRKDQFAHGLSEEEIISRERDIDLIFVGGPYNKVKRLMALKNRYGRRFKMYGHWGSTKDRMARFLRYGVWIRPLPWEKLVPMYLRTKIGINMHLSFGPSNKRLFQLPANGVLQLCDCKGKGLEKVFDVGKEVIGYSSIEQACEYIDNYLNHSDERMEITKAGYQRILKDYRKVDIFLNKMDEISQCM